MHAYIHHCLTLNQFNKSDVIIMKCSILVQSHIIQEYRRNIMSTTSLVTKMISSYGSIKICLLSEFCYYYINIGPNPLMLYKHTDAYQLNIHTKCKE